MDLAIPYQKLEVGKIHIVPQPNGYLPFHYKDGAVSMNKLFVLTPMLTVAGYNPMNGRIDFEPCESLTFVGKIMAFQEVLRATLLQHQNAYNRGPELTAEDIERGFKNLYHNGRLSCYINMNQAAIKVHNKDCFQWQSIKDGVFSSGKKMRLCIKFSGVKKMLFNAPSGRSGVQFRIDHQIVSVYDA
jgi:hypothetical protein